jgi:hypothetical protein
MSKSDGGLRAIFQKHLPQSDWEFSQMETGGTVQGVPDVFYRHSSKTTGWIENKKTTGWAVDLEPHQAGWLFRHAPATRCTVAVRASGLGSAMGEGDALYLLDGSYGREIKAEGLRHASAHLLVCTGPPRSWDWGAVEHVLLR